MSFLSRNAARSASRLNVPSFRITSSVVVSPTSSIVISPTSTVAISPTSTVVVSPTSTAVVSPTTTAVVSPTATAVASPTSTAAASPTSTAVVSPLRTASLAARTATPVARITPPPTFGNRIARFSSMSKVNTAQIKVTPTGAVHDNKAADVDQVLKDIADYVHDYKIESPLAWETARLCLIDTLGCGLEALNFEQCTKLLGPVVPGTIVPNGTKVPGTPYQLDPIRGAFNIGTTIRWLDYNDCWLAAEWGHPSDNLGGILAVTDWLARTAKADPSRGIKVPTVKDVLEAMIKAHEIQGCLALENSFNRVGLDHVVLVKVATTAVVSKLLGLTRDQTIAAVSQAWVDGQSLRTYRHVPNTMSRKSWAAGDACSRAVNLALMVKNGGVGAINSVFTAKIWGFYDVLFKGKEFKFQRPYGSYVMENVLFKISYPAEFHSQTACEAAMTLHHKLKQAGKTVEDIKHIRIRTQEAAVRIIDKKGPLHNYADRDHCIQYMVAVPLIFGRLTTTDYSDAIASDPRIDALREKMECVEDHKFSAEYHHPDKRSIGNAILITFNNGTTLEEVEVEYPVGHKFRREEGIPLLMEKFARHLRGRFDEAKAAKIEGASIKGVIEDTEVDKYVDLYVTEK